MCYKIYNNLVDVPFESFFTKPARSYSIRGHPCILRSKQLPHHAFRAHFYTERVIPIWNHLPHDVVTSLNITVFHTRLRSVTYHPIVRYILSMFRQFVSAHTHCANTCLFAYVCVFICMQSINQSKSINSVQKKSMFVVKTNATLQKNPWLRQNRGYRLPWRFPVCDESVAQGHVNPMTPMR